MEWFQSLISGDSGSALQLVMITLALVVILVLLVWLFKRVAGTPSRRAARNRVPRLSITDVTAVDDKRFLILARRDNVEHLILIGGANDVVVETDIVRTQPAQQRNGQQSRSATDQAAPAATAAAGATAAVATTAAAAPVVAETLETTEPKAAAVSETPLETPAAPSIETEAPKADVTPDEAAANIDFPEITEEIQEVAEAVKSETELPQLDEPELSPDLESEISQQLDDALNVGDLDLSADIEKTDDSEDGDDDMQKLLKELAAETR